MPKRRPIFRAPWRGRAGSSGQLRVHQRGSAGFSQSSTERRNSSVPVRPSWPTRLESPEARAIASERVRRLALHSTIFLKTIFNQWSRVFLVECKRTDAFDCLSVNFNTSSKNHNSFDRFQQFPFKRCIVFVSYFYEHSASEHVKLSIQDSLRGCFNLNLPRDVFSNRIRFKNLFNLGSC